MQQIPSHDIVMRIVCDYSWQFVPRTSDCSCVISRTCQRSMFPLKKRMKRIYENGMDVACPTLTAAFHERCNEIFAKLGVPEERLEYRDFEAYMQWQIWIRLSENSEEVRVVVKLRSKDDRVIYKSVDGEEHHTLFSSLCKAPQNKYHAKDLLKNIGSNTIFNFFFC